MMTNKELPKSVSATIKEISDSTLLIKTEDDQMLKWPKRFFVSASVGQPLSLIALTHDSAEQERAALARALASYFLGSR